MKKLIFMYVMFLSSNPALANIEGTLTKVGRNGQRLFAATLPLFALGVAWAYKKGDAGAKDKATNLIIGTVIAVSAFGVASYFK